MHWVQFYVWDMEAPQDRDWGVEEAVLRTSDKQ